MFDVVVVGYNTLLHDVPVLSVAQDCPLVSAIFFCDNSQDEAILKVNSSMCNSKLAYVAMGGNRGLSVAYNRAVAMSTASHVCLFDDDTLVPPDYFVLVKEWIESRQADVYLPLVHVDGHAFSPARLTTMGRVRPDPTLAGHERGVTAINTGMAVARRVFTKVRYDERLFLDFVDHRFMDQVRASGFELVVMSDVRLEQAYSLHDDTLASATRRLRLFRTDSKQYYRTPLGRIIRIGRLALRVTRLVWRRA